MPEIAQVAENPEVLRRRVVQLADFIAAVRAFRVKQDRTLRSAPQLQHSEMPATLAGFTLGAEAGESWLRVQKVAAPRPPVVPATLRAFVSVKSTEYMQEPPLLLSEDASDGVDLALVTSTYQEWLTGQWGPWAKTAEQVAAVRNAYERIDGLRLAAQRQEATHELIFGFGVLRAVLAGEVIEYPLAVAGVDIVLDVDRAVQTVVPNGPLRLQTDVFAGIDHPGIAHLLELAASDEVADLDPWDVDGRWQLFERVLRRLGRDPVVVDAGSTPPECDVWVEDSVTLALRPRETNLLGFLRQLAERMRDDAVDDVALGALASLLSHHPSLLDEDDAERSAWHATANRLLMPLPTNPEQETIARRLAQHRLVAVQGPPGTGKTHTIANLISHLVAHGKRVLVVAQQDGPLKQIRDKVPDGLRALCISVTGSSAHQMTQLEVAVNQLQGKAQTLDLNRAEREIEHLHAQLEQAERDLAATRARMRDIAERDARRIAFNGEEIPAQELAAILATNESTASVVPDQLALGQQPPLLAAEFTQLVSLARMLTSQERDSGLLHLPARTELPDGAHLARRQQQQDDLTRAVQRLVDGGLRVDAVRKTGRDQVQQIGSEVSDSVGFLQARADWCGRAAQQAAARPQFAAMWHNQVQTIEAERAELATATAVVVGHQVDLADAYATQPRRHLALLDDLRARFAAGKGPGMFQRELSRVRDGNRVDDEPLRTADDVDVVTSAIRLGQLRNSLIRRWNDLVGSVGGPTIDETSREAEFTVGQYTEQLSAALKFELERWPALRERLTVIVRPDQIGQNPDASKLRDLAATLRQAEAVFELDDIDLEEQQLADVLTTGAADPAASPLWRRLDDARRSRDFDAWTAALEEADRHHAIRPDALTFHRLINAVRSAAPAWAAKIEANKDLPADGEECLRAWHLRAADCWLAEVLGTEDGAALAHRANVLRDEIRRLVEELTVASAWLEVARGLDDPKRAALAAWSRAIRKIGKHGKGKFAASWTAEAQRQLRQAQPAVPVWIMSVQRALQQFRGGAVPFDVVIVDESSQCDLYSIPVLALGKRAVVVGDDQQIGPQIVGVDLTVVRNLIEHHLDGVPFADFFDVGSSLYDHALRAAPQSLMLREHFRCVPEIITFSSMQWYGGKVEPLRTDRSELPAIMMRHVPHGVRQQVQGIGTVNVAEADELVDAVAACVADPAYDGKTMGVVSLLSTKGEAGGHAIYLQQRLRERLGDQELERRNVQVGDPYTFQGAERDVMFLSLVVSANDGRIGVFTKQDDERRVNVAASRARDQMWVFHSIKPEELHSDDARGKLLAYCADPYRPETYESIEQACGSQFERDVLKHLLARGLKPIPQYQIGGYRIDFVVPTLDGRRLAIECDGDRWHGPDQWDEDLHRQGVLERVGSCVFARIRGTAFYRNPSEALAPVWELAEEIGILPGGSRGRAWQRPTWTAAPVVVAAPAVVPPVDRSDEEPALQSLPEPAEEPRPAAGEDIGDSGQPHESSLAQCAKPESEPLPQAVREADDAAVAGTQTAAVTAPEATLTEAPKMTPTSRRAMPTTPPVRLIQPETSNTVGDLGSNQLATDLPHGYRNVGWIREIEATTVLSALKTGRNQYVFLDGHRVGEVRYFPANSKEARQYRAQTVVIRFRNNGEKRVGWIREAEARAIIRAMQLKRDVPILHNGTTAGLVQYFAPTSEQARTFKSQTRLLRRLPSA